MTHSELVTIGAKWLNKQADNIFTRSQFVVTEFVCQGTNEIPDIFGIRPYGSVLIEVKVSRNDFKRDALKRGRNDQRKQLGKQRYFLVPEGLVQVEEIYEGWGLLYCNDAGIITVVRKSESFEADLKAELYLYYSVIRRCLKPQVFNFRMAKETFFKL